MHFLSMMEAIGYVKGNGKSAASNLNTLWRFMAGTFSTGLRVHGLQVRWWRLSFIMLMRNEQKD